MLEYARTIPLVPTVISPLSLMQRICVRPPYFALSRLLWQDGELRASAVAEQPQNAEVGPMQAAEIGRHAAICGLSAAALLAPDDERRYYLAQEAHFVGTDNTEPYGTPVDFAARVAHLNKRSAEARITAAAGGRPLATVQVRYTILPEASFGRLFRSKRREHFTEHPHVTMLPLPEQPVECLGGTYRSVLPVVPELACAGHFDQFPAMPVAILMGELSRVAGAAFGQPYRVASADLTADDFCWAGEAAEFRATPGQLPGLFDCETLASGAAVGHMTLRLMNASS